MKLATLNSELISLYLDMLQQPVAKRCNMKELIFDVVPTKRALYQVYLSVNGFNDQPLHDDLINLPASEVRFIRFLQGTLFTSEELNKIRETYASLSVVSAIPDKYQYRAPVPTKAFSYYGRKFGRQIV
jgi:hypothetical protein